MHRAAAVVFAFMVTGAVLTPRAAGASDYPLTEGTFDAALAAARKTVPESSMIDARLIKRGDSAIYEILLMDVDGVLHTVRVDAARSRVLDRFGADEQGAKDHDEGHGGKPAPGGKGGGPDRSGKDRHGKGGGPGKSGGQGEGRHGDGRKGDGSRGKGN